jgi:indole-3-glycerol phosphate synthase
MDILQKIIAAKKPVIENLKLAKPVKILEKSPFFEREIFSMKKALLQEKSSGIIAEFKRKSPSKGFINRNAGSFEITTGYARAGASGLSVLTDSEFFGGNNDDLMIARKNNSLPLLRKDFIFDEYQIVEAKSIGADIILLIAEALEKKQIKKLAQTAKKLGLEVLMEIHDETQLDKLTGDIDIIGVNNRNLKTFEVNIENSIKIFEKLPSETVKISESGIRHPADVIKLKQIGYHGFLIGENFMKTNSPAEACKNFIDEIWI